MFPLRGLFFLLSPLLLITLALTSCSGQTPFPLEDPNPETNTEEVANSGTPCQADTECEFLEICFKSFCQTRTPSCGSNSECPPGSHCSGDLCLEEGVCYFHYQCPNNMKCDRFRCVSDRCQEDSDCGEGESCDVVYGVCREPRCQSDQDCSVENCCYTLTGFCVPSMVCDRYENGIPENCDPQPESCDRLDNDCDGSIDEDFSQLGSNCSVGTGVCLRIGHYVCNLSQDEVICNGEPGSGSTEVCDGVDNDCDGSVDEGC